jgi:hypothetical protein
MPVRPLPARVLGYAACVALLQGCASHGSKGTNVAPVSQPPEADVAADSAVPKPSLRPFRPSAPDEIVSEGVIAERRLVVGDMLRIGLVTTVEQGPLGVLRVGIGERFHSHHTREFHFAQLASAYYTWTADGNPLLVELWEGGRKIGESMDQGFRIGPRYAKPVGCPENATTGLCALLGQPAQQVAAAPGRHPGTAPEPAPSVRQRSRVRWGLGLGGGAMDFACDGCVVASRTGFSGFLSIAASVRPETLLGVEGSGWTKSESGASARVYSVMANVTQYLSATSGLFLRAGVGLVGYREDTDLGDRSARAPGFSSRLGYELEAGAVGFAPYVGLVRTFAGADVKLNGQNLRLNVAISNVQFGLSITTR